MAGFVQPTIPANQAIGARLLTTFNDEIASFVTKESST